MWPFGAAAKRTISCCDGRACAGPCRRRAGAWRGAGAALAGGRGVGEGVWWRTLAARTGRGPPSPSSPGLHSIGAVKCCVRV